MPALDRVLRRISLPIAVINVIVTALGAYTGDLACFLVGWAGASLSFYGWLLYRDLQESQETR